MKHRKFSLFLLAFAVSILLLPTEPALAAGDSFAQELLDQSGAGDLPDLLDDEARELLESAGVEQVGDAADAAGLFSALSLLLREKLAAPGKALGFLLTAMLLCRLAGCFDAEAAGTLSALAGSLCCTGAVLLPLLSLLAAARQTVEGASAFLAAAVPVYAALLAASGSVGAGTAFSFWGLLAANALPLLSQTVIFPGLRLFLALALASAVSELKLERLSASLYAFLRWLLVLSVTVFSAILSVQTALTAQADAAAARAVKLAASAAMPLVGGAFGDAAAAIQSSVQLLRSGAGAFGLLAALALFAPNVTQAACWVMVCYAGRAAGDMLECPRLSTLLSLCADAARMILAVLLSTATVCLVSAAVLLFVRQSL